MNDDLLQKTLDTIALERGHFAQSFHLANDLLKQFGEEGIVNRLYSQIPPDRSWEDVADLFGIFIWSTTSNVVMSTMEEWLRAGDDARKLRIALDMGVFPFKTCEEMEAVFQQVSERYPELQAICDRLTAERRTISEKPKRFWNFDASYHGLGLWELIVVVIVTIVFFLRILNWLAPKS